MADNNSGVNIIKRTPRDEWFLVEYEDKYYFFDNNGDKPVMVQTPSGNLLSTQSLKLAERMLDDLLRFGPNRMCAESALPWQYTIIDNFSKMEHTEVEKTLDTCFLQNYDWTYDSCDSKYDVWFGDEEKRPDEIRGWLSRCITLQMTAACCVGNAYHSLNVPYVLAWLYENFSGRKLKKELKEFAEFVADMSMCDVDGVSIVFNTFMLFYGVYHEKNIIEEKIDITDAEETFIAKEDVLIGRNYYLYTDGMRDENQPFVLETDLSDIEENEDDPFEFSVDEYSFEGCWVKKISAVADDEENYYIISLTVTDDVVEEIFVFKETVCRVGSSMFYIPGMEMPARCFYEEIDEEDYPDAVMDELNSLENGRHIPNKFTFIGKRLPQEILDLGGNGGDMTDHTYALQSAYRLAYMHMSVTTDEEGTIADLSYSTYQSTGSSYGDMFSRPQLLDDRHEEIVDMLLHIIDSYDDYEYESVVLA